MGLVGAGFGASQSLEEIVAQRLLRQRLEQEVAERQQRFALDQQRFNETARQNDFDRSRTERLDTEAAAARTAKANTEATQRRGRSNMAGVVAMGLEPATAKREIAFSALNNDADIPSGVMEAITPPKKREYTYTDPKTGAKSLRYADAGEGPIDLGREPEKQIAGPKTGVHVIGGNLVDDTGKVIYRGGNPQGADPAKAAETRQSMIDTARSLRNHPGLPNLTGARIGNPDYGLGVSDEPIGGSQAADAKPFYDRLKALFTVDNIGLLKGVLSDSDMKILASVGTSLDTKMTDPTFVRELDRILEKLEGTGASSALPPMDPMSSRGTSRSAPSSRVDELIKKYGGGGA